VSNAGVPSCEQCQRNRLKWRHGRVDNSRHFHRHRGRIAGPVGLSPLADPRAQYRPILGCADICVTWRANLCASSGIAGEGFPTCGRAGATTAGLPFSPTVPMPLHRASRAPQIWPTLRTRATSGGSARRAGQATPAFRQRPPKEITAWHLRRRDPSPAAYRPRQINARRRRRCADVCWPKLTTATYDVCCLHT